MTTGALPSLLTERLNNLILPVASVATTTSTYALKKFSPAQQIKINGKCVFNTRLILCRKLQ